MLELLGVVTKKILITETSQDNFMMLCSCFREKMLDLSSKSLGLWAGLGTAAFLGKIVRDLVN
jgi:hypothetical protein